MRSPVTLVHSSCDRACSTRVSSGFLGGAFPPAIDFVLDFETSSSADPDYGVIVHRFMGQAATATINYPEEIVSDEVTAGVEYNDYPAVDADDDGEGPHELDHETAAADEAVAAHGATPPSTTNRVASTSSVPSGP